MYCSITMKYQLMCRLLLRRVTGFFFFFVFLCSVSAKHVYDRQWWTSRFVFFSAFLVCVRTYIKYTTEEFHVLCLFFFYCLINVCHEHQTRTSQVNTGVVKIRICTCTHTKQITCFAASFIQMDLTLSLWHLMIISLRISSSVRRCRNSSSTAKCA